DRSRAADTERQRQDGRGSKDGRETELTDRITDGAGRVVHADRLDGSDPQSVDPAPNARRQRAPLRNALMGCIGSAGPLSTLASLQIEHHPERFVRSPRRYRPEKIDVELLSKCRLIDRCARPI